MSKIIDWISEEEEEEVLDQIHKERIDRKINKKPKGFVDKDPKKVKTPRRKDKVEFL